MFNSTRKHVVDNSGAVINKKKRTVDDYLAPKKKTHRSWLIFFVLAVLAVITWFGIGSYQAFSKIITENKSNAAPFLSFLGEVKPEQLQGEGDGRINILLIGIGGQGHPGGQLADTIQIISIDPTNNKLAALSIPRDLYVPVADTKYYSKINRVHADGETNTEKTGGGPALLKKTVSNILDLPIHYYIKLDFEGFEKFINELGGIDIYVDKSISDPYYPDEDMIGYEPFYIKVGQHHLDGSTALKYARSRETTSDFDRSRRQQQIMLAVKDKTLSLGVLANPAKTSAIISILGKHLRTDLQLKEIERLANIFKDINPSEIVSRVLDSSTDGPLMSYSDGGYFLKPRAGNFSEVANIAHELFSEPYIEKENARIEVLNGSSQTGIAKEVAETLESYGYNIVGLDKTDKEYAVTAINDYTNGQKPYTVQFLKERFTTNVKAQPTSSNSGIDISLIIGEDYLEKNNNFVK